MIGWPLDWQPASDDGAGFGRHAEMSDAALDDEAHAEGVWAEGEPRPLRHDISPWFNNATGMWEVYSDGVLIDTFAPDHARAAQVLHNTSGMEAGGLLMMPPDAKQSHSDATGVA